jgi:hypothetical protein
MINNKKELIILLRLRQIEKYLENKLKANGDSKEELQQLIIVKNTIAIIYDADADATGVNPPANEWGDLTEEDWHCCNDLLQSFMGEK